MATSKITNYKIGQLSNINPPVDINLFGMARQVSSDTLEFSGGYPFVMKDANYTVSATNIALFGVGVISSGITVFERQSAGIRLRVSRSGELGTVYSASAYIRIS